MVELNIGDNAPEIITTVNGEKKNWTTDFEGKKILLFFYPKDNTPGCTAEACNLRDNYNAFIEKGYQIVGVSPDSEEQHKKFSEKFQLPFLLIPDTEKEILQAYGAWGEKKMYGKTSIGVKRSTFLISEERKIEKIFKTVKTKEHAEQIFKSLKTI